MKDEIFMEIIRNYDKYLSSLQNGQTSVVFGGEVSILEIYLTEGGNIPNGMFYVWEVLNDSGIDILLKVENNGETLRILEGFLMENALMNIANSIGINDLDVAIKWWDMCYHRDKHGIIRYDSYYDRYYAANESDNKLSDFQEALALWIEDIFAGVEGLVYVLGNLANCNPVIYQLQQKGLETKTVSIANSENVSEFEDRILQLREQLAIPCCDANIVNVSLIASNGIDNCPAECHRSYLITIPIDLISIDDNAVGSFSYKDILPSEKFCLDYSCCGHDYSYVEMELFADLHGNTVLKTTNSKAESKYTIINRFNYTNLQKNGQSN